MPTYKSKVEDEERRDYWLHRGEIDAAQAAVVKAALAWHAANDVVASRQAEIVLHAACADLKKLGG
jgi:hypothetical protein